MNTRGREIVSEHRRMQLRSVYQRNGPERMKDMVRRITFDPGRIGFDPSEDVALGVGLERNRVIPRAMFL